MTVTQYQGVQTTFANSPNPTANLVVTVKNWGNATDPRETPLLDKIGFGEALNERPVYWGQSYRRSLQTTAAETVDQAEAAITVATGTGKYFRKGHIVEIIDFVAGSTTIEDESTKELMLVTSTSGDAVTFTRGVGGTSDVAHVSGCNMYIVGSAEKEYETSRELDVVTRGSQFYNYFQRFNALLGSDIAARNLATWEFGNADPLMHDFDEARKDQHLLMERSIFRGGRAAGSTSTPALFGGIDTFITTNADNLSNAKITPNLIESELRDLFKTVDGGGDGLIFLMSPDTAAIWDRTMNPIRQATAQDTGLKLYTDYIQFRWGKFEVVVNRNCRNGVIYGIKPSLLKMHPFKGADWHIAKKEGKLNVVDHDLISLSGDFTLVVKQEHAMFRLYGFNQNETVYSGYQTFGN